MATQPEEQPVTSDSQFDDGEAGGEGIGAGALATAGLGLIALAILIWFLAPRFSGESEPSQSVVDKTPAATTAAGELITATPLRATVTSAPVARETQPPETAQPSPTQISATPTLPIKVQEGVYARVAGTGSLGLRYRSGPGEDYVTWRILPEGDILKVTGGPEEINGVIWWRALDKTGLVGWTAEQYLVPVEPPPWTPEPERTPDITEPTATSES
ncbi:MAG: hypothetical protein MAG451_02593 [Anaerolineales bacterium]|nr:hypothetical protein [Anaerolineales bacterium]